MHVTMRASSTFRPTAFGIAIVRGLMSWARRLQCSNVPCDTMNYGDAVGVGLREASAKVAARAIPQ